MDSIDVIATCAVLGSLGGLGRAAWMDIRKKEIPQLKYAESDESSNSKATKDSKRERDAFIGSLLILSMLLGGLVGALFLGIFGDTELPNIYLMGVASVVAGFLVYRVGEESEKTSLSALFKYFFGKNKD